MRAGLTFAPLGVAFALSSLKGRSLHAKYGRDIISVGAAASLVGVIGLAVVVTVWGVSANWLELSPVLAMIGIGNGLVIPLIVQGVLLSVPSHRTGAASGMLATTQQFSMVIGIAAVGTLFFAREATSGIVSALQAGLIADIALVAFAFVMTLFLPRTSTSRSVDASDIAGDSAEDVSIFDGAL
jgi:MFS family permease